MIAYCCRCGEKEQMGDPDFIMLCGLCVQECIQRDKIIQHEYKKTTVDEKKILKRLRTASERNQGKEDRL